uniref:Uncharacterized protein n=1 Tax=Macaca fascicularis TaxID=9541 RepID=Q9GML5_MACFA|nr:hypothetical protein [Macaca fascicularis]
MFLSRRRHLRASGIFFFFFFFEQDRVSLCCSRQSQTPGLKQSFHFSLPSRWDYKCKPQCWPASCIQ